MRTLLALLALKILLNISLCTAAPIEAVHYFVQDKHGLPDSGVIQGADGALYGYSNYLKDNGYSNGAAVYRISPNGDFTLLGRSKFPKSTKSTIHQPFSRDIIVLPIHIATFHLTRGMSGWIYGLGIGNASWPLDESSPLNGAFRISPTGDLYRYLDSSTTSDFGIHHAAGTLCETSDGIYGLDEHGISYIDENGKSVSFDYELFRINSTGKMETVYKFLSPRRTDLAPFITCGSDGAIYGVTALPWLENADGLRKFFRITAAGEYSVLHTLPAEELDDLRGSLTETEDGWLYGVTSEKGKYKRGGIFRYRKDGSDFQHVLFFNPKTLLEVTDSLVEGPDGDLYGAAAISGGRSASGAVFKLSRTGELKIIHRFGSSDPIGHTPIGKLHFLNDGSLVGVVKYSHKLRTAGAIYRLRLSGIESNKAPSVRCNYAREKRFGKLSCKGQISAKLQSIDKIKVRVARRFFLELTKENSFKAVKRILPLKPGTYGITVQLIDSTGSINTIKGKNLTVR